MANKKDIIRISLIVGAAFTAVILFNFAKKRISNNKKSIFKKPESFSEYNDDLGNVEYNDDDISSNVTGESNSTFNYKRKVAKDNKSTYFTYNNGVYSVKTGKKILNNNPLGKTLSNKNSIAIYSSPLAHTHDELPGFLVTTDGNKNPKINGLYIESYEYQDKIHEIPWVRFRYESDIFWAKAQSVGVK